MVNKVRLSELQKDEPPVLDESWWEAVLAEEERFAPCTGKSQPAGQPNSRPASGRAAGEQVAIDWKIAGELYEQDKIISLQVIGYNRGGLLVCGAGLQGFVPISHLVEIPGESPGIEPCLEKYLNQAINLKIIECDHERGRVVFSQRAALARPGVRIDLLETLQPGDVILGTVTNVTDFGIFVDLGGVEGLVHVSEISWGRVNHPTDAVNLGEALRVYVIQVDRTRARVALSLKRLHPNPWVTAEQRYQPGQIVDATVTSIVPFGAFARLEEGLDGLIHISEMMDTDAQPIPAAHLQEGQNIRVRILHVDCGRQRLGLSLHLDDESV
ncbi:MAG: rpsA [Chloroflexi bacterium]|jgi:small subunit ribosomal protein S1|nr:rpsA [Chloroflexota bacterium]